MEDYTQTPLREGELYVSLNEDVVYKIQGGAAVSYGGKRLILSPPTNIPLSERERTEGYVGFLDPEVLVPLSREDCWARLNLRKDLADSIIREISFLERHYNAQSQPKCTEDRLLASRSKLVAKVVLEQEATGNQTPPIYSNHPVARATHHLREFVEAVKSIDTRVTEIDPPKRSSEFLTMPDGPWNDEAYLTDTIPDGPGPILPLNPVLDGQ